LKKEAAFIWKSARDGFSHLYVHDLDGNLLRPLTAGDWTVVDVHTVDEEQGAVYFTATKDSPLERQLYSITLNTDDPTVTKRISAGTGTHGITFADDASVYVDTFSNVDTPPQVGLHKADGRQITWIEENRLDSNHPFYPYREKHGKVEFGTIQSEDGQLLYYSLIKPVPFDPDRRYPVFVKVYGGPHGQQVRNRWYGARGLHADYLVQNGYVYFQLDNRGTGNRGTAFDDPIYGQLGEIEVRDQVRGVEYLRSLPFVDPARIGIFGWSYGGYMAIMAMAKAPGYFQAGVAVAPVTDYMLYDTHYTERYLGNPLKNTAGYDATSVFPHLDGLQGSLLVMHGMADDNVLFSNSTRLFKVLQERGMPFEMMTYPGGKHSLTGKQTRIHVYKTMTDFLDRQLKTGPG
jgi:dipeptidyl-peptidase-4